MATFADAIETILAHEGGWAEHPNDPGGATNFGISLRWAKQQGMEVDIDMDGDVDADDIRKLPREEAINLYRKFFWSPFYEQISSQDIATKVFDLRVNAGASQAHIVLQRACKAAGAPITEDGLIGPGTIAACNKSHPQAVLAAFRSEQAAFYRVLVAQKSSFSPFLNGWLKRAYA